MKRINVVLYHPEIPQNTGNIMRSCVGFNAKLHLIKPLGFKLEEKQLRRSCVDYYDYLDYEVYENFNDFKSKNDGVFYFHCSQGKDRAGLAAYILEIALGVSPEEARKDYLLTNEAMKIRVQMHIEELCGKDFYNETYEKALYDVFSAKEEYLDHALDAVNEKYGSIEKYITDELCVDVDKLRALYLE